MPASIRIIKIVKDIHGGDAYTIEFECEAEDSKELLSELTKSPYGQRAIELLNRAEFLPEEKHKTAEELKVEAEKEMEERKKYEERLKQVAASAASKEAKRELLNALRDKHGDKFVEEFEKWIKEREKIRKEAKEKKEEETEQNTGVQALGPFHGRRGLI